MGLGCPRTSVGSIMSLVPATIVSYCFGPSHSRTFHLRVKSNLKYWLENRVGLTTHGLDGQRRERVEYRPTHPSKPLRSAWHRPERQQGNHLVRGGTYPSCEHPTKRRSPDPSIPSGQRPVGGDRRLSRRRVIYHQYAGITTLHPTHLSPTLPR
jgi:hypothetical protein